MNWAKVRWRMVNWLQWKKDEQNLVETRLSWVDEQKSIASKNILNSKFQFYLASFQSSYAFEFLREIRSIGVLHQRMQVMMFWCFKWPPSIDSQTLAFGCSCHCCYTTTFRTDIEILFRLNLSVLCSNAAQAPNLLLEWSNLLSFIYCSLV